MNERKSNATLLADAERFLQHSGRLLERLRFEHTFRKHHSPESAAHVLSALRPYQNDDGGFGQILEPDFRGPVSQPLCVDQAFRVLDELKLKGAFEDALATRALTYLTQISAKDGGVPNVLLTVGAYPRAPWWHPDPAQPGSLLPTASLAGLLYKNKVEHPWLRGATQFTWQALTEIPKRLASATERLPLLQALYETRAAIVFLDHVPDRKRAEQTAQLVGQALREKGLFRSAGAADAEAAAPLDFAHEPTSLAARWFDEKQIDLELDALLASQEADGGFPITWQVWTPLAGSEWRGIQTLDRLKTLRAYGRLPDTGSRASG
jgi:hypothetical protein